MMFYTIYNYLLWISASIYGSVKSLLNDYFSSGVQYSTKNIYISDGYQMIPFRFDIPELNKHRLLFYVVIQIDDTHTKVVVFNSLDKLIINYNSLEDLVKIKMPKFSKFLEVKNTRNPEVDHLDTFSQYTDKLETYYTEITGYNVRSRDIYDFKNRRFLLSRGDNLHVTRMDFSNYEYNYEEQLRS